MTESIGKAQIEVEVDAQGVETGVARAKRSVASLGDAARKAGQEGAKGLDELGKTGSESAGKTEAATKRLIQQIERQTLAMGKSKSEYYEQLSVVRNLDQQALRPYIERLRQAEAAQLSAGKAGNLFATSLGSVRALAGSLGVGLSVTAVAAFAAETQRAAVEVERFSRLAGSSAEEFQRHAYGARQAGVEADKYADIIKDVQDKLGDFMQSGGGPLKDFFDEIGAKVGVTAESFRTLSGPQALQLFYSTLERANLSQQEMVYWLEAIASDATLLQPLLRDGGAEFRRLGEEAERAGRIMSDEMVRAAKDVEEGLRSINDEFAALRVSVGGGTIETMAAGFREASAAVRELDQDAGLLHRTLIAIGGFTIGTLGIHAFSLEDQKNALQAQIGEVTDAVAELERREYLTPMQQERLRSLSAELDGLRTRFDALTFGRGEIKLPDLKGDFEAQMRAIDAAGQTAIDGFVTKFGSAADKQQNKLLEMTQAYSAAYKQISLDDPMRDERRAELLRAFNAAVADLEKSGKRGASGLSEASKEAERLAAQAKKVMQAWHEGVGAQSESDIAAVKSATAALREQLETLGMTAVELAHYRAEKLETAAAADEHAAAELEAAAVLLDLQETLPEVARSYREMARARREAAAGYSDQAALTRELAGKRAAIEAGEAAEKAQADAARKAEEEWQRSAQTIEQSLTDALMRGFENGEGFADNFKQALENMFRTMVLRPVIQAIVSPVSGMMNGLVNSLTGGLLGGGGGGAGSLGLLGNLQSAYSTGNSILDYGGRVLDYGRDLYNYASGMTTSVGGQTLYTGAMSYAPTAQMSAAPGYTSYFGAQSAYGNGVNVGATGAGGTGVTAAGSIGAGLAGGLWAYQKTGSYSLGVAGAAGSTALYGAAAGYASGAGAMAGMSSALGTLGPYGWIAAIALAVLGDIFAEDPDPRVTYKMKSEIGDLAQWEDGDAYRAGPFGYVGLDNEMSREVDSKDFRKQLDSLVAFDNMLASLMSADEIERVRTGMDGWMSSANRNDRDFRRNGELALTERMIDIAQAAGGEQWDELLQYLRTTTVGSPRRQESYGYGDAAGMYMTAEPVIPEGTTLADLFGFRAEITDFSALGDTGAGAAALRTQLADLLGLPQLQADLEYARANQDSSTLQAGSLTRQIADVQAQIPQSLDALAAALEQQGMDRAEIERIALAAANANPYGAGRDGNRLAKLSEIDSQALGQYLIQGLQVDDLQTMLGKLGQSIGRMDAREWMDASATTVTGEDGKPVDMDGYAVLMTNLSQSYATLYQTADDVWKQAQDNLKGMFDGLGVQLPRSTDEFKRLTEAQDLNTEAGRELYQELWGLAPAFLEVAAAVEQTFAAISQSTAQTVEMFQLDIMSNAEKYAFIDDRITATLEQLETAVSPDQIAALYSKANEDLKTAWGLLQDDEKRRLQAEYIDRAYELETLSQERLSIAPLEAPEAQTEAQATAIGKAVEEAVSRALAGIATQMQSAGTDQSEAAAQLGAAVASLPERIVVEIRAQGGEVMLG